jgi:hypothetical protein
MNGGSRVTEADPAVELRPATRPAWRRIWRAVALVVAVICIGHFAREVWRRWSEVSALAWSPRVAICFGISTLITLGSALLDAISWAWLLRGMRVPATDRQALGIFGVSQFAKYIGNVGQHIGRVALTRRQGWQTGRVILSMVVENGFALGAGTLVVGSSLLAGLGGGEFSDRAPLVLGLLLGGWVLGVLALRRLFIAPPAFARKLLQLNEPIALRPGLLAAYLGTHIVSYGALGAGLAVCLWGVAGSLPEQAWKVPAAATASWLIGYLLPGAPAGIGVRETALHALLGNTVGADVVVAAALIWRASALLSDALLLGVGALLSKLDASADASQSRRPPQT